MTAVSRNSRSREFSAYCCHAVTVGSDGWIVELYKLYGAEIFGLCRRAFNDNTAAEEVTQDVFVKAWKAASRFDSERASARTWIYAIAKNLIIDRIRANSVRPRLATAKQYESPVAVAVVESDVESLVDKFLLEQLVRELDPKPRILVVEVYLKDRPLAEVAAELDLPIGTVKSRLSRALDALRLAAEQVKL